MLRLGILAGLAAGGLTSVGCTTPSGAPNNTGTDALVGTGIGAGAGAVLGSLVRAPVAGALIGGAVGASTGAAVGNAEDRQQYRQATATAVAQAQAQVQARMLMPVDVVKLVQSGVDETNIINQIRVSGCPPLDTPNLEYLHQSGVSPRIIAVMQDVASRPPAVVVAPPPGYYYGRRYGYYPY
jgi:hypothetical protein